MKGLGFECLPVRKDDAVGVGVEDADEGVGLDEGLDLVEDERPFELKPISFFIGLHHIKVTKDLRRLFLGRATWSCE